MCFRKEKGDMSIPIKRMAGMTKRRNRIKIAAIFGSGLEGRVMWWSVERCWNSRVNSSVFAKLDGE